MKYICRIEINKILRKLHNLHKSGQLQSCLIKNDTPQGSVLKSLLILSYVDTNVFFITYNTLKTNILIIEVFPLPYSRRKLLLPYKSFCLFHFFIYNLDRLTIISNQTTFPLLRQTVQFASSKSL